MPSKKWLARYLHHAEHNPKRITKVDKLFGDELDFEDIEFKIKIRDIRKTERKNSIGIKVFGHENKEKYTIKYQKNAVKKNMLIYY